MNDRLLDSYVNVLRSASKNDAKKFLKSLIGGVRKSPVHMSENRMRRVIGMPGVVRDRRTGVLYEFNANSGRLITLRRKKTTSTTKSRGISERQLLELLGSRRRRSFF